MVVYAISTYILNFGSISIATLNRAYTIFYITERFPGYCQNMSTLLRSVCLHSNGIKCKDCVLAVWQADIPALSCRSRSRWHDTRCRPAKTVILSQCCHTQTLPEGLIIWWVCTPYWSFCTVSHAWFSRLSSTSDSLNTTPFSPSNYLSPWQISWQPLHKIHHL